MTLGYLCGEQKNLSGFQYQYEIQEQNTTQCDLMQIPQNVDDFYLQRNQFYNHNAI